MIEVVLLNNVTDEGRRPILSARRFVLIPKLATHEWLLSANGEVRYTLNTSRSNGCFRGIIEFR